MSLRTFVTSQGGVTIIRFDGKITVGGGAQTLHETLKTVFGDGATKVLLDLGRVGELDSAGLGALFACYATAKNTGATLKFLRLQTRLQRVMQVTKLDFLFETFEDETAALRSFSTANVKSA